MMKWICLLALLLTGCTHRLSVQTQYLDRDYLASYQINTPDPSLESPSVGQRLIIQWDLPACYKAYSDLHMTLLIRLRNREERFLDLKLNRTGGIYLYPVVGELYQSSGGIATYKVEIIGDGQVLDSWIHPLWVDLIHFEE